MDGIMQWDGEVRRWVCRRSGDEVVMEWEWTEPLQDEQDNGGQNFGMEKLEKKTNGFLNF